MLFGSILCIFASHVTWSLQKFEYCRLHCIKIAIPISTLGYTCEEPHVQTDIVLPVPAGWNSTGDKQMFGHKHQDGQSITFEKIGHSTYVVMSIRFNAQQAQVTVSYLHSGVTKTDQVKAYNLWYFHLSESKYNMPKRYLFLRDRPIFFMAYSCFNVYYMESKLSKRCNTRMLSSTTNVTTYKYFWMSTYR